MGGRSNVSSLDFEGVVYSLFAVNMGFFSTTYLTAQTFRKVAENGSISRMLLAASIQYPPTEHSIGKNIYSKEIIVHGL